MVNMGELFAHRRIPDIELARVPLAEAEAARSALQANDLLFARRSLKWEGAGKCSIVLEGSEPRTFESSIIRARVDPGKGDPRFYFYYFNSEVGRARIETIIEQVAVAGIRGSDLGQLLVPVPDLSTQNKIADQLWALDERITDLTSLIDLTEDLMRALYQRTITGASGPRTLVPLGDLVESVKAKVRVRQNDMPYVGLEHMPQFGAFVRNWGRAVESKTASRVFEPGDILFGRIRPYLGKVGRVPVGGVCAQSIEVLRPRDLEASMFALLCLTSFEVINYADAVSTGTTMPQAPWDAVEAFEVPLPPREDLLRLQRLVEPLVGRAESAVLEVGLLEQLRESCLARLMTPIGQPHPRPTVEAVR
jgi:type I restriction enzyme S subunit